MQTPASIVPGRLFASAFGLTDGPATGGACGPLGCYLVQYGWVSGPAPARIHCEPGLERGAPACCAAPSGKPKPRSPPYRWQAKARWWAQVASIYNP